MDPAGVMTGRIVTIGGIEGLAMVLDGTVIPGIYHGYGERSTWILVTVTAIHGLA